MKQILDLTYTFNVKRAMKNQVVQFTSWKPSFSNILMLTVLSNLILAQNLLTFNVSAPVTKVNINRYKEEC